MTVYKPYIFLHRLVIYKSKRIVYEANFHVGVNIIRGRNSSGKTTISDFIFYALGGDIPDWTPEARQCDMVYAQINLSGNTITVSRSIETSGHPPIEIYEGEFNEAISDKEKWSRYPNARSESKESYSQIFFHLMGMPEHKSEVSNNNITMHQILRLIYCDQLSKVEHIFRDENFDNADIRTAVSELLLGLDNYEVHDLRLRLRNVTRKFDRLHGELKSLFQVLGKTEESTVTISDYQSQIDELDEKKENTRQQINELTTNKIEYDSSAESKKVIELENLIRETKLKKEALQENYNSIVFELADSYEFIKTLKDRLVAVDSSQKMSEYLGQLNVEYCPVCLSKIEEEPNSTYCNLCKTPFKADQHISGHLRMRQELQFQLRESEKLLNGRQEEKSKLNTDIEKITFQLEKLEDDYKEYLISVNPLDAKLSNLYKKLGYIERHIEESIKKKEIAELISRMIDEKASLSNEISVINDEIDKYTELRRKRRSELTKLIVNNVLMLLHEDLDYEEVFQSADKFEFDFSNNKMLVQERRRFSASSMIYVKNCFLFSLFLLSLQDSLVRFPRFILLDNLEDKGTEPERSANLQKLIVKHSQESNIEHQIIFTTSMIDSGLENSDYCIGPHYDENYKTLGI